MGKFFSGDGPEAGSSREKQKLAHGREGKYSRQDKQHAAWGGWEQSLKETERTK